MLLSYGQSASEAKRECQRFELGAEWPRERSGTAADRIGASINLFGQASIDFDQLVGQLLLAADHPRHLQPGDQRMLGQCRMQRAKMLLRESTLGIKNIAERVGYRSESAFCQAFKREYGESPARMRRATC